MLHSRRLMTRLAKYAVNMLTSVPIPSVNANPCMTLVPKRSPNQNRTALVMSVATLLSLMDGHARANPSVIAAKRVRPARNSSFVRSAIKIFASTAVPIVRIKAAIPERVRVTGASLNTASVITA